MSLRPAVGGLLRLLASFAVGCGAIGYGAIGCGPAATSTPTAKPKPPPPAEVGKPLVAESPARWVLHAPRTSALRSRLSLPNGAMLYGGGSGERWLDRRDGSFPISSGTLSSEPVVGLARGPGDKGILVVGASGAIRRAVDPIGALDAPRAGPPRARGAAAGARAVVAIVDDGLVRTVDAGATWAPVGLSGSAGTLVDVALNESGLGVALFAPQRAFVTQDDGATWSLLPTPGIGARRLVVDANGDLAIEGLEASAILRTAPLRFERVSGLPRPIALETKEPPLGLARAIAQGRAIVIGDRYVEVIPEADDPTHWRIAQGPLGSTPEKQKLSVSPCDRVWIAGSGSTLHLACDDHMSKKVAGATPPPPSGDHAIVRLYRSDDAGASWLDDGVLASRHAESGHLWLAPDGALLIDGACKRVGRACNDVVPLIRNPGKKQTFAKIGLPHGIQQMGAPAFDARGAQAYALGRGATGGVKLLVSADGGRDFHALSLPSIPADGKLPALVGARAEPGSVTVDAASGLVIATARFGAEWAMYSSTDQGATVQARRLPHHADALAFAGKRGFAWHRSGAAWESSDGGATWMHLPAPSFPDLGAGDRGLACNELGCLLGDRAARVGWGGAASSDAEASPKIVAASALRCTLEAEWKNLGPIVQSPSVYDAEIAPGVHWTAIKQDRVKGSVSVVLGKQGAKGLEVKEVSLFGPAPANVATGVVGQIEGAAAIRFAFKRDANKVAAQPSPPNAVNAKDKKPQAPGAVVDGQMVDVEVAWYVAQTGTQPSAQGAVHRATLRGVGPLDARDVFGAAKDAATANVGLLSIAQGGVHVRPFATRAEVPLYFVRDNGKSERLGWPTIPSKDAGGSSIALRLDAIRSGNRSVLLGVHDSQLWTSWANETGTAWEAHTWGLWPDLELGEATWDFAYVPASTGKGAAPRPAIVLQHPGGNGLGAGSWAVPLRAPEADPGEVIAFAAQKALSDPPAVCTTSDARVVAPFSSGTRHPIVVVGEAQDLLLGTTFAAVRGDEKSACLLAYEARSIAPGAAKKSDDNAPYALVPWADKEHSSLFRSAANGELSVRSMSCAPSKEAPPGLGGIEGFVDEP